MKNNISLEDVLGALNDAGISYEPRPQSESVYDEKREGTERQLYRLSAGGYISIYTFPTVAERKNVQVDPFPTASVSLLPNGTYGMDRILVFYYYGNDQAAQQLAEAFEPLHVEVQDLKLAEDAND